MRDLIVIGGGPAGMMAAIQAAAKGKKVTLIEKNEKLGKKLFITGKGRCNVTNACDVSELFGSVVSNEKFLYSAFYGFSNQDTMDFFEDHGLRLKIERGQRVFPKSDKSSDVIKTLARCLEENGVEVRLSTEAAGIKTGEEGVEGVILRGGQVLPARKVLLATGGCSYPSTGSTGDGINWAKDLGHKIKEVRPGLVGMLTEEDLPARMQGLALKNISLSIYEKGKKKPSYKEFGELLFAHYGVSGPLILSVSSLLGDKLKKGPLTLSVDLKPALTKEQLDARILRDFQERQNSNLTNALGGLLPKSMIPVILEVSGLGGQDKVHQVTKEARQRLLMAMKDFRLTLTGLRNLEEAIISRGGVSVKDVNPSTMESKQVPGLYFAGEILDLDALTGGFNLQIAWSTAYVAGQLEEG
ncbi:MAG: NAD(P)/FAD-dependent oxidoreductase [Eubacterium sp.]|nr:NAD(P)/FAD-dependent oxidoreductase [Eubacterium sp.]